MRQERGNVMDMDVYSKRAAATVSDEYQYGTITPQLMGMVLGLGGEAGEVQEKFKKLLRDKQGKLTDDDMAEIVKELGDVLWYVSVIADLLGSSLAEVAQRNNDKLASRHARGMLGGSGDNR